MAEAARLAGVTRSFGRGESAVHALRGVNLEVLSGEMLMIVGPSGCGKTTLVTVLSGMLTPDSGEIEILGTRLDRMSAAEQSRFRASHLGFVFQSFNLISALTLLDNVMIAGLLAGLGAAASRRAAAEMLDRVGLGHRLKAMPAQLSGGQMQRVAIARAMVHRPSLVVADEPTSALDHENGHAAMVLLRTLVADGSRALVVVSHDPRVYGFADRIATMEDGHIVRYVRRHVDPDVLKPQRARSLAMSDAEALAELQQGHL